MVDKPKHPGTGDAKEVGKIEEKTVEGVKVRIYRPFVKEGKEDEKLPILFHIHGGGFVCVPSPPFPVAPAHDTEQNRPTG